MSAQARSSTSIVGSVRSPVATSSGQTVAEPSSSRYRRRTCDFPGANAVPSGIWPMASPCERHVAGRKRDVCRFAAPSSVMTPPKTVSSSAHAELSRPSSEVTTSPFSASNTRKVRAEGSCVVPGRSVWAAIRWRPSGLRNQAPHPGGPSVVIGPDPSSRHRAMTASLPPKLTSSVPSRADQSVPPPPFWATSSRVTTPVARSSLVRAPSHDPQKTLPASSITRRFAHASP